MEQRDRNTTTAEDAESAKNAMFVCEVPLRNGFQTLEDLPVEQSRAWFERVSGVLAKQSLKVGLIDQSEPTTERVRALPEYGRA